MHSNRAFFNFHSSRNKNDAYLNITDVKRFMSQILLMWTRIYIVTTSITLCVGSFFLKLNINCHLNSLQSIKTIHYRRFTAETEINIETVEYSCATKIKTFRSINGFYFVSILFFSLKYGSVKTKDKLFKWIRFKLM